MRIPGWIAAEGRPLAAGLGGCAVVETLAQAAARSADPNVTVELCLVALFTTVPLALDSSVVAAWIITGTALLSLAVFHALTVAGAMAQLLALFCAPRLLGVPLAAPFLVLALAGARPTGSEAAFLTVLLASLAPAAALAGIALRARREATVHQAARAAVAADLVEHTARGERARIARELHDVVAHHISMIAVQAETARVATPGMPALGARRLFDIGETARAGLTEMRRLLGVLREGSEPDELHPQPCLDELNELLDEDRRRSGSTIRLIVSGTPLTLDPGVDLAAYRIVQEALTNARRHAPGAAIDIELRYTAGTLQLSIHDSGLARPHAPHPSGHGLSGMGERATAVGGKLRAGPSTDGGFLVRAELPLSAAETGTTP